MKEIVHMVLEDRWDPDQAGMNEQDASGMQSALISRLRSAQEFCETFSLFCFKDKTEET